MADGRITVFLADDNVIVREGVRALLSLEPDLEIVGVADDYDSLVGGAEALAPQVLVTDIRMPPNFLREGIDAAQVLRKRHPGTGVVVLSQYDDPDYAISLLGDGAAGYAYLLKDRVGEGDQLARAVREVATGGSVLDPKIVEALVAPGHRATAVSPPTRRRCCTRSRRGDRSRRSPPSRAPRPPRSPTTVDALFLTLSQEASVGPGRRAAPACGCSTPPSSTARSRGRSSAGCCPAGSPTCCATADGAIGETEELDVTVLMGDIRGYSTIAEHTDPTLLAALLSEHRAEMNHAILDEGGTVMQFVGDAVMACFGAPLPLDGHADRAVAAACAMICAPTRRSTQRWASRRAARRSAWGSASRPGRWRPRCSGRRSGSSTRWWATR